MVKVISVALAPVGGLFATGSGDWRARIWRVSADRTGSVPAGPSPLRQQERDQQGGVNLPPVQQQGPVGSGGMVLPPMMTPEGKRIGMDTRDLRSGLGVDRDRDREKMDRERVDRERERERMDRERAVA